MNDWQPIETAPKGGKWVLLAWPDILDIPFTGYCVDGQWFGLDGCRWEHAAGPTHWMELPPLPTPGDPNA